MFGGHRHGGYGGHGGHGYGGHGGGYGGFSGAKAEVAAHIQEIRVTYAAMGLDGEEPAARMTDLVNKLRRRGISWEEIHQDYIQSGEREANAALGGRPGDRNPLGGRPGGGCDPYASFGGRPGGHGGRGGRGGRARKIHSHSYIA